MFSVIIPAYNAEKFIMKSIKSVLAQIYTDFELIIVDDGSIDGTKAQIKQFNDDRIRYIYQENGGVSVARNKGIIESKGEFICFLDADDEWKPNHLEVLCELIEKYSNCGIYITGYDIRLNNGSIIHKSQDLFKKIPEENFTSDDGYDVLIKHGYFCHTNTICCRREVFDKVGLFEIGVKNGEDDDMWYRVFAYYPVAISKKTTTIYNRDNCGATGQRTMASETPFLSRVDSLLESVEVPQNRKISLLYWVERNKLSRARKYILVGNKSEALKTLKTVAVNKVNKKKYFQTVLCMIIPVKLIQKFIDRRDNGYYQQ